jgi:hypothetical protein
MTGNSKVVNTRNHKYLVAFKIPNSITLATVVRKHHKYYPIRPRIPQQYIIKQGTSQHLPVM